MMLFLATYDTQSREGITIYVVASSYENALALLRERGYTFITGIKMVSFNILVWKDEED